MSNREPGAYDAALVHGLALEVGEELSQTEAKMAAEGRAIEQDDRRMLARTLAQRSIANLNQRRLAASTAPIGAEDAVEIGDAILNRLFGLGRLQQYVDDPQISDIFVNGARDVTLRWRDGSITTGVPVAANDEELIQLIQTQARRGRSEQRWDPGSPELNLQLPTGDRLHAIAWVSTKPTISIRRHNFAISRLKQLVDLGTINEAIHQLLKAMVLARFNILVAGGTGAGKTTLLRCLINEIPADQRLVTVEDALELGLSRFGDLHPNLVELESRHANVEGVGEVTMTDLVRSGLRMGPDRVIVGEIRGAEVVPMLLAMSQGNDGSMSTIHADSSAGVFPRLQMYMAMTAERFTGEASNLMAANALDVVVHIAQIRGTGRAVTSIREVTRADGELVSTNEIYAPDAAGRAMPSWRFEDSSLSRLADVGFDPRWLDPQANRWGNQ